MFKVKYKKNRIASWTSFRCFWTYFTPFSSVSLVDFEQVNVSWGFYHILYQK